MALGESEAAQCLILLRQLILSDEKSVSLVPKLIWGAYRRRRCGGTAINNQSPPNPSLLHSKSTPIPSFMNESCCSSTVDSANSAAIDANPSSSSRPPWPTYNPSLQSGKTPINVDPSHVLHPLGKCKSDTKFKKPRKNKLKHSVGIGKEINLRAMATNSSLGLEDVDEERKQRQLLGLANNHQEPSIINQMADNGTKRSENSPQPVEKQGPQSSSFAANPNPTGLPDLNLLPEESEFEQ